MPKGRRHLALVVVVALFSGLAIFAHRASTLRRTTFEEEWTSVIAAPPLPGQLLDYGGPLSASFKARPLEVDVRSFFPGMNDPSQNSLLWVKVSRDELALLWQAPQIERFRWWGMEWVPDALPRGRSRGKASRERAEFMASLAIASLVVRAELEKRLEEYVTLVAQERSSQRRLWRAHLQLRRDGNLDLAPIPSDWLDPVGSLEERAQTLEAHIQHLEKIGERVARGEEVDIPEPLRSVETPEAPPPDRAPLPDFALEAWRALWEGNPRSDEFSISATARGRRAWVRSEFESVGRLVPLKPQETFVTRLATTVETVIELSGDDELRALLRSERRRLELYYGGGITPIEITRAPTAEALETLRALERALGPSLILAERPVRAIRISGDPTAMAGWHREPQLPRRAIRSAVLTIPLGAAWVEIMDWLREQPLR